MPIDPSSLPTNVDHVYPDSIKPGVKAHQRDHDLAHSWIKEAHAGILRAAASRGTTLGETTYDGTTLSVVYTSNWGIDSNGQPYFNPDGAAAGEEAVLILKTDGTLALVQPQGVL